MATVRKRKSDEERGKAGKYTCYFIGADGKRHSRVGVSDRAESQRIANHLEDEARKIRDGRMDAAEVVRREARLRGINSHVNDYEAELRAKGDTEKHCRRTSAALSRLFEDAAVDSISDLAPDRVRAALGRMKARPKGPASARTCNFYIAAVRAFATWLHDSARIESVPRGIAKMEGYNEKEDRRLVRRALTMAEVERLFRVAAEGPAIEATRGPRNQAVADKGPPVMLTGQDRALLYRLAMGTGFRAEELRTLTPERFALDGDEPTITVLACYAKNGREAVQPITPELADSLRPLVEGKPRGKPVLAVPEKTARMLKADLARAEIDYRDEDGRIVDFHALRGTYITHLIESDAKPKVVQALARHSTIVLTLERYTHLGRDDLRAALAKKEGTSKTRP